VESGRVWGGGDMGVEGREVVRRACFISRGKRGAGEGGLQAITLLFSFFRTMFEGMGPDLIHDFWCWRLYFHLFGRGHWYGGC